MMNAEPRNSAPKTRGRPFQPGNAGKPKGARHRMTVMAEQMMTHEAEAVVKAVIDAARGGDMTAAKIILDRIAPVPKGRRLEMDLPAIDTPADVSAALNATISAMAGGLITPDEASTVSGVLAEKRRALEVGDIEERVRKLEQQGAPR